MSTSIVICDDSSFARKQMARALPENYDLNIAFANDGAQGLEAIRQNNPEIVFLDLNMPVMDGYETLAAIRDTGLLSKVIVVSGDIQPDARKRVMELGAEAFIKKPVNREEIAALLGNYHLKSASPKQQPGSLDIETDVRAGYQEIANVAMGRAIDLLARLLDVYIQMPIPNVNTIEKNELRMAVQYVDMGGKVSAVCQGFIGSGIAGEALLIFDDASFADMAELMKYQDQPDESMELELLMDISSILISAFLKGIGEQLDIHFSQGHPIVLGRHVNVESLIARNATRWDKTLAIETSFSFEKRDINCELLFLFTEDSIAPLNQLISFIMPE
ncbi:MAG: response regulator [Gammaproteobacteria bacterium]|jgi:chemotaxis protein CheY-P-specific phosphatase CheC/CheY-like chemotaxis protein